MARSAAPTDNDTSSAARDAAQRVIADAERNRSVIEPSPTRKPTSGRCPYCGRTGCSGPK